MCIEWKSREYGKYLDYTLIGLLNSYIVLLINSNIVLNTLFLSDSMVSLVLIKMKR